MDLPSRIPLPGGGAHTICIAYAVATEVFRADDAKARAAVYFTYTRLGPTKSAARCAPDAVAPAGAGRGSKPSVGSVERSASSSSPHRLTQPWADGSPSLQVLPSTGAGGVTRLVDIRDIDCVSRLAIARFRLQRDPRRLCRVSLDRTPFDALLGRARETLSL